MAQPALAALLFFVLTAQSYYQLPAKKEGTPIVGDDALAFFDAADAVLIELDATNLKPRYKIGLHDLLLQANLADVLATDAASIVKAEDIHRNLQMCE